MSDFYNVLVIVSYGNTPEDVNLLSRRIAGSRKRSGAEGRVPKKNFSNVMNPFTKVPYLPEMALIPREAVQSPWERVRIEDSVNRVSAEVVTCYPPGIPILYPGEVISQETLDYLEGVKHLAFGISGPEDRTLTALQEL